MAFRNYLFDDETFTEGQGFGPTTDRPNIPNIPGGPYNPSSDLPPYVIPEIDKSGGGGSAAPLRPTFNISGAPAFDAPQFVAPSMQEALSDPGYLFRLRAGTDALERTAAAKGALRTGGHMKGIVEYGQTFGANEYNNMYNRALATFDRRYRGAKDSHAVRLAEWQLRNQAEIAAGMAGFNAAQNHSGGGTSSTDFFDQWDQEPTPPYGGGGQGFLGYLGY